MLTAATPRTDRRLATALLNLLESPLAPTAVTAFASDLAGGTTLGCVRTENQDRHLIVQYRSADLERCFRLAVVADGVGSLPESGLSASAGLAAFVGRMVTELESLPVEPSAPDWPQLLREAVQEANEAVCARTGENGAATLAAILLPGNFPPIAVQVGDSKIFGLDEAFQFTQLCADQTMAAQLQARGVLTAGSGEGYSPLERALAQFLGQPGGADPEIRTLGTNWSALMVATDGIMPARQLLTPAGWQLLAESAGTPVEFVRQTLALTNALGGTDNTTLVLLPATSNGMTPTDAGDGPLLTAAAGARTVEIQRSV